MLLFLFFVAFNNFFTSTVLNENARLALALVIPKGTPIAVAKDAIETPLLATDKKDQRFIKVIKNRNIFAEFFTH